MPTPLLEKFNLWRESGKGVKTVRKKDLRENIRKREDITEFEINQKLSRGDKAQTLRLRYYPSIDVDHDRLFAGKIQGSIEDAEGKLMDMGYRNNPTAYVEVTEEHGPDDGSYARQYITETGAMTERSFLTNHPSVFRRLKRQVHVTLWQVDDEVLFLAHEEKSAWLQPLLHVTVNDSKAKIGVREFRNDWYDTFGEELGGKQDVEWEVLR